MKRFLSVSLLLVLSIFLAPTVSTKFDAVAGRTQAGNALSPECSCGVPGPPCYDENSWQLCNDENGMTLESSAPQKKSKSAGEKAPYDGGSVVLTIFVVAYLLRRFLI
jgi:hypothetical protein